MALFFLNQHIKNDWKIKDFLYTRKWIMVQIWICITRSATENRNKVQFKHLIQVLGTNIVFKHTTLLKLLTYILPFNLYSN